MDGDQGLHQDGLDLALSESRYALRVEQDRIADLERRTLAIVGFAGFMLPVLGGLVPDAFSGLASMWQEAAISLYLVALALLSATITYSLLASRGGRHSALNAGALTALAHISDASQQQQALVKTYSLLVGEASRRGELLHARAWRASLLYVVALLAVVSCVGIIGLHGGF